MNQFDVGYERGWAAGARMEARSFHAGMLQAFATVKALYLTAADLNFAETIRAYDHERLACEPDYARFPEMRGLLDRHYGERQGFRDATGLDETGAAFHCSWGFYVSRRLNARHVARYDLLPPLPSHCTNIFFPDGVDGVTVADNRDDVPTPACRETVPAYRPAHLLHNATVPWQQGAASATILLDEEPGCSFPCDPFELMPADCLDDIRSVVEFMTRYREFYGPGKFIWADRHHNAVAVEKANCRVAFRWPTMAGAVCIGDFSYLDPALRAYKKSCLQRLMTATGTTPDTSLDWQYDLAADRRHERLQRLVDAEAARGATVWGALAIVSDTELPFPDRVCVAGEKMLPDKEPVVNWTLTQHAAVITGPDRRLLYRSMQDIDHPQPITTRIPRLLLGPGVTMKPAWLDDIVAGRCRLDTDDDPAQSSQSDRS